jgi:hypothetical protein
MKTCKVIIIIILAISSQMMFGQPIYSALDDYHFYKNKIVEKTNEYHNIDGSAYLNSEFVEGTLFLKDTTAVKLPLRYNIYTNEMEYQYMGVNYVVGNPQILNKVLLGESVFVYLTFIPKEGYFEVLESGKCFLFQKRSLKFKPAEGPKPVEGVVPAKFVKEPDVFYIVVGNSQAIEIEDMKSVINALQDQKPKIESFIKQEKINRTKKENLIEIAKYYNSL